MSEIDALRFCRLAPLVAWREMAMLDMIHKAVLVNGPAHFREFFVLNEHAINEGSSKHRL